MPFGRVGGGQPTQPNRPQQERAVRLGQNEEIHCSVLGCLRLQGMDTFQRLDAREEAGRRNLTS